MEAKPKLSGLMVSHLMSSNVICIEENDPVSFVIQVFDRCHISGAPVRNQRGEYVGVISKTDLFDRKLLDFLKQHGSLDDLPVRYIMNPNAPMAVSEETTVEKAAEIMLQHRIHRLFIKDGDEKIKGIVTSYDILRVVAAHKTGDGQSPANPKEQQILNLRDQLSKGGARKAL